MKSFIFICLVLFCACTDPSINRVPEKSCCTAHSDKSVNNYNVNNNREKLLVKTTMQTIALAKGQTLAHLLTPYGLTAQEIWQIAEQLEPVYPANKLRAGEQFTVYLEQGVLQKVTFFAAFAKRIVIEKQAVNWQVTTQKLATTTATIYVTARVETSLYKSALENNIPVNVIQQFLLLYSYTVDFQRELRRGDQFAVIYKQHALVENPAITKLASIEFTKLVLGNKTSRLYAFADKQGNNDFYNDAGRKMGSFLMKTPLDGARLSSYFGKRKHPVLGYTRIHKGIDFGAPVGTPIFAAGKGVITKAGREGSFGNVVKIKHARGYLTLYAHLNGFAKGIKKGVHVKQGQTIGYLGNTGLSQARHLHYEIHKHGRAIDPLRIKDSGGETLKDKSLSAFLTTKKTLDELIDLYEQSAPPRLADKYENHHISE